MTVLTSDPMRAAFASPTSHSRAPSCTTCGHGRRFGTDGMGTVTLICDHCAGEQRANEAAMLRVAKLFQLDVHEAARRLLAAHVPPPFRRKEPLAQPPCKDCGTPIVRRGASGLGRQPVRCAECRRLKGNRDELTRYHTKRRTCRGGAE